MAGCLLLYSTNESGARNLKAPVINISRYHRKHFSLSRAIVERVEIRDRFVSMASAVAALPCASLQEIIFDPRALGKDTVTASGIVVLKDPDLQRIDITDNGAKLIVRFGGVDRRSRQCIDEQMDVGSRVLVTGKVRKQQRRTFLEATSISFTHDTGINGMGSDLA